MARWEGRKLKRRVRREHERALKEKHAARIRELREQAREAKRLRKEQLKAAKRACDERVNKAVAQAQKEFQRARELALAAQKKATKARHAARKAKKQSAREKCALDRQAVKAEAKAKIELAKAEERLARQERREYEAAERTIAGRERRKAKARKATRKEAKQESDDLVRSNLDPSLWPLWDRRKRYTKGNGRRTRTEVFLDWVHDNPEEVLEAQMAALPTDDELAQAEAAAYRDMVGSEVPF